MWLHKHAYFSVAGGIGGAKDPGRALPHPAGQHGRQQARGGHHHPQLPCFGVEGERIRAKKISDPDSDFTQFRIHFWILSNFSVKIQRSVNKFDHILSMGSHNWC